MTSNETKELKIYEENVNTLKETNTITNKNDNNNDETEHLNQQFQQIASDYELALSLQKEDESLDKKLKEQELKDEMLVRQLEASSQFFPSFSSHENPLYGPRLPVPNDSHPSQIEHSKSRIPFQTNLNQNLNNNSNTTISPLSNTMNTKRKHKRAPSPESSFSTNQVRKMNNTSIESYPYLKQTSSILQAYKSTQNSNSNSDLSTNNLPNSTSNSSSANNLPIKKLANNLSSNNLPNLSNSPCLCRYQPNSNLSTNNLSNSSSNLSSANNIFKSPVKNVSKSSNLSPANNSPNLQNEQLPDLIKIENTSVTLSKNIKKVPVSPSQECVFLAEQEEEVETNTSTSSSSSFSQLNAEAQQLFSDLNEQFFGGKIQNVTVRWTLTLRYAVFSYEDSCIKLSFPLLKPRPKSDLLDVLLVRI